VHDRKQLTAVVVMFLAREQTNLTWCTKQLTGVDCMTRYFGDDHNQAKVRCSQKKDKMVKLRKKAQLT